MQAGRRPGPDRVQPHTPGSHISLAPQPRRGRALALGTNGDTLQRHVPQSKVTRGGREKGRAMRRRASRPKNDARAGVRSVKTWKRSISELSMCSGLAQVRVRPGVHFDHLARLDEERHLDCGPALERRRLGAPPWASGTAGV